MASKLLPSGIIRGWNAPKFSIPSQKRSIAIVSRQQPSTLLSTSRRRPPSTPSRPTPFSRPTVRLAHSIPPPPSSSSPSSQQPAKPNTPKQPSYELTFTCVPCDTRSSHNVSKQGYHHGSVLITCPSCRNRHVIADHLNIFGAPGITVEKLMEQRGRLVKRGTLGEDGDLEFWEDGTTTVRAERQGEGEGMDPKPVARAEAGNGAVGDAPGSSFGKA